jgi:hypothetical protein
MYDDEGHGCGSVGRWVGVLCAALGVVTAFLMISLMGLGWFFKGFTSPPIQIGLIALFIAAGLLGTKAGVVLCNKGNDLATNVLVGIGLAFASITIAVVAGSISVILMGPSNIQGWEFLWILVVTLLVMLMYGGIPAVLLGVLYGVLVRDRLRKLGHYSIH